MTLQQIIELLFGVIISAIVGRLLWVSGGNKESVIKLEARMGVVEKKQEDSVTKEDIREVIKEELGNRDKLLSLQMKEAVSEGWEQRREERKREMRTAIREELRTDPGEA